MEQENNRQLTEIADSLRVIASSIKKDSREELYHSETHCPSCGRFVGTETRCPYCQAETQKRLSIRVFKVISVVISTLGLLMLLFYARNVQTPQVNIKDLGPLSNFAHVRIVGYANQNAKVNKWGTLSFSIIQYIDEKGNIVTDKTKFSESEKVEIKVSAYKKVTADIPNESIPQKGDEVEVEGQIRVQQNEASMLINAPEHLRITASVTKTDSKVDEPQKDDYSSLTILAPKAITSDMISKTQKVLGIVKNVIQAKNDCIIINLDRGDGNVFPVFVPSFSQKGIKEPQIGQIVECVGVVKEYNGGLELDVAYKGYIKVTENK